MSQTLIKTGEVSTYAESVINFIDRKLTDERFTALRLQHGVYGQRQDGLHMIRIKVPGGILSDRQFAKVADVLEKYAQNDIASVTTRQDIQLHYIPLPVTALVLEELAEVGLTTREACGNTVRNITACSLAGVCSQEHTDINVYLQSVVKHFLRHPLTQHLPRKFKMSFSGCETDCAQGLLHDLAVIAVKKDNEYGLKILVGGGLGHKPHEAIVVEEFLAEKDLLPCIEAVIGLHHRYSDRKKRAKSRIKFLVDKFGPEGLVEQYQQEFARIKNVFDDKPYVQGIWHERSCSTGPDDQPMTYIGAPRHITEQKQAGLFAVPVSLSLGDLTANQIRSIVSLMQEEGLSEIRVTQDQSLIIVNVPQARLDSVEQSLIALQQTLPVTGDDVVSCPGTWTCRLGITASREVAKLASGGEHDLKIRVSGCHNGCAQPHVGDIGLHGEGRRKHGKLLPFYRMHFGGEGRLGQKFALKGPELPAARVVQAINRVKTAHAEEQSSFNHFSHWAHHKGPAFFAELLQDLSEVSEFDAAALAQDHGNDTTFKVEQFGGGECAGITQETLDANLAEITHEKTYRNTFSHQNMAEEAVECAEKIIQLSLENLLFITGKKMTDPTLDTLITALDDTDIPKDIHQTSQRLILQLTVLKDDHSKTAFESFTAKQDSWLTAVEQHCRHWEDQQPTKKSKSSQRLAAAKSAVQALLTTLDLSTETCPMHYVKARMALKNIDKGEVLPIRVQQGEATRLVADSLRSVGYEIIKQVVEDTQATTVLHIKHPERGINTSQNLAVEMENDPIAI